MHSARPNGSHEPVEQIEVLPLTSSTAELYFGKQPQWTLKGYVLLVDGEAVGCCGISWQKGQPCFFTEMKEDYYHLRGSYTVLRKVLDVMKWVRKSKVTVYAQAQNGDGFYGHEKLTKLGFAPISKDIYTWRR